MSAERSTPSTAEVKPSPPADTGRLTAAEVLGGPRAKGRIPPLIEKPPRRGAPRVRALRRYTGILLGTGLGALLAAGVGALLIDPYAALLVAALGAVLFALGVRFLTQLRRAAPLEIARQEREDFLDTPR